jgi:P27 family predicted phage terminase small subunit
MPATVHALHGNPSKKPAAELAPTVEPEVKIPDPPAFLCAEAREEWVRIAPELKTLGLVAEVYARPLAAYCVAYGDWARARVAIETLYAMGAPVEMAGFVATTPTGYQQLTGLMVLAKQAEQRMLEAAREFGLTPSSRTKVTMGGSAQLALFPDQGDPMVAYTRAASNVGAKA